MNKNEAIEIIKELNHLAHRFIYLVKPVRESGGGNSVYDIIDKITESLHKVQDNSNISDEELKEILK